MAPWDAVHADDLDDPLSSAQSEIAWQVDDLSHRLEAIRARVGGKSKDLDPAIKDVDKSAREAEKSHGKAAAVTDVSGEKKMREAYVLLLLLRSSVGGGRILIEVARESASNPGKRKTDPRLPEGKMEQNEDLAVAANRMLREMQMDVCTVSLELDQTERFTEESESASMQGAVTTYHMTILPGYVNCVDDQVLRRIGLHREGAIWSSNDDHGGVNFYTWMTERQAQTMKVRTRATQNVSMYSKSAADKERTLQQHVVDLTKKIDTLYNRERRFVELESGMRAITPFLHAEHSSVQTVVKQNAAKCNYVLQHAEQLQEFANTVQEIESLVPHLNPPHLPELPAMCERVQRLEAGAALLGNASSRLHERVAGIAQDYHTTILAMNAQMLAWDKMLDDRIAGK